MLTANVDGYKTLKEFYEGIRSQQEDPKNHGPGYCAQHDAMISLMKECESYKELGTHQGTSAAAACLTNPKRISLVDITMEKFNVSKRLFDDYCNINNIELEVLEMSSLDPRSVSQCDLLLVDSVHKKDHLTKELELHSPYVKKFMVFHDTHRSSGKLDTRLYDCLVEFTSGISRWHIIERSMVNVGYTVLKRVV
jgi:hypothetical protein